jgi:hypothetical protein
MKEMKLTLLGDIMCLQPQDEVAATNRYNYSPVFEPIESFLKLSDLVVGNLETNFAGKDMNYTNTRASFNTPNSFAESLKAIGLTAVVTANNHCLDRGVLGLKRTLDILDYYDIKHTGTYRNERESQEILIIERSGIKIALVCATYGTNSEYNNCFLTTQENCYIDMLRRQTPAKEIISLKTSPLKLAIKTILPKRLIRFLRPTNKVVPTIDCVDENDIFLTENITKLETFKEKINHAKELSDIVIVYVHVGGQFNDVIGNYTSYVLSQLKATNADIILGNHPHCVLPHEIYNKDKLLTYAIGNFTFTPNCGYWMDGVLSEYGIIIHIYCTPLEKKISKITYSVIKNIIDQDGYSRVYLVSELISKETNKKKQRQLICDMHAVMLRFNDRTNALNSDFPNEFIIFERN